MTDELRTEMMAGFGRVDRELGAIRAEMTNGFTALRAEFAAVRGEMKQHAEETRRHFDIVAESFKDQVKARYNFGPTCPSAASDVITGTTSKSTMSFHSAIHRSISALSAHSITW